MRWRTLMLMLTAVGVPSAAFAQSPSDPPPADTAPPADVPPPVDVPPPADQAPPVASPPEADRPPPADRPPHADGRRHPPRYGPRGYGPPPPGYGHGYGPPPGYGSGYGTAATGYRTELEPIYGMVIAGAAAFGGAWFVSAMVATAVEQHNETVWLYIPLAGPFITLGARDYETNTCTGAFSELCESTSRTENTYAAVALVLDGIIQAGGLAVFIAGLTVKRERHVPTYTLAPLPVNNGGGLQVVGSF